ncbi:MAG: GNAT family N-acetyltransferase [Algicola sp.]|nr:GNAT family N-acetyltransferase [Algicola sp.]
MEISSQRIKLRLFDDSDLDLFIELSVSTDIMAHVRETMTVEEAKAAFEIRKQPWTIQSGGWLSLTIIECATDQKLGSIGLKIVDSNAKIAEVGFLLRTAAQGRGFASESLKLVCDYAFDSFKLNKIVGFCSAANTASAKLMEKLGFVREGCLRQNTFINNGYVDDYVYGLCLSDKSGLSDKSSQSDNSDK